MPDPEERSPPGDAVPGCPGGGLFAISIRGRVGDSLRTAFSPMQVTTLPGQTVLRGLLQDQAALYGVLARIQDLGLELDEVRRLPGPP